MSSGLPTVDEGRRLDADALLDRATESHATLANAASGVEIELYHRATLTRRASIGRDGESVVCRYGADEGSALRSSRPGAGESAFSATTGSGVLGLRRSLDRSLEHASTLQRRRLWPRATREPRHDRQLEARLPARDEATAWIRRALEFLPESAAAPLDAWVECAQTVETWVASGGFQASRVRKRAFAYLRPAEAGARPLLTAGLGLERLPESGWRSVLADRWRSPGPAEAPPTRPLPLLFNPESSAILVHALVRAIHYGEPDERPVGPAWRIADNPVGEGAVWGGTFDDAGFKTRSLQLADGLKVCGTLEGSGHYRRPSFRDRPVCLPSQLIVDTADASTPDSCLLATDLGVHPIEPDRWLLRIGGALLERGRPGPTLRPCFVTISPMELVRRCVAAVGPSRSSYLGVETPALVFDAVTLQSA